MVEIVTVKVDGSRSISNTNIETIYTTIARQTDAMIINLYLRTICKYEMETLDTIREIDNDSLWSNFIVRDHLLAKGCRKKEKVIGVTTDHTMLVLNDLRSILDMDSDFTKVDVYQNLRAHILTSDGIYLGHLYTWEDGDTLYVDAIRSSISNILDRSRGEGVRGILARLIDSSIKVARLVGLDTIRVRDPYSITKHVLSNMGFNTDHTFLVERDISTRIEKYRLIISAE